MESCSVKHNFDSLLNISNFISNQLVTNSTSYSEFLNDLRVENSDFSHRENFFRCLLPDQSGGLPESGLVNTNQTSSNKIWNLPSCSKNIKVIPNGCITSTSNEISVSLNLNVQICDR